MSCDHGHNHHCGRHSAECDDQLPLIARVGRGIKGDSFKLKCVDDEVSQANTRIHAYTYDETTKQWTEVQGDGFPSANINGGRLHCYYHLNRTDDPQTFTMEFIYKRDGRSIWSFVTPAIPYSYYDRKKAIVGSTVGTVFLKDHKYETGSTTENDKYNDMLTYPGLDGSPEIDRDDFNAPLPPGGSSKITNADSLRKGEKRDANSTFIPDGSEWNVYLDLCEFKEFAKITGLANSDDEDENRKVCLDILNGIKKVIVPSSRNSADWTTFNNIESDNIKDYIDDMFEAESTKRGTEDRRIESELKERIRKLEQYVAALEGAYENVIEAILGKFYKGGTLNIEEEEIPSGEITPTKIKTYSVEFPTTDKAAIGTINISGYNGNTLLGEIKTHDGNADGDIKAR